jgi:zinc transport system ATP-binding protein
MTNAVEIENLSFAYSNTLVLEDVNFSIREGEFIGVIGPNGGGKTTLLNLLMGFLKPIRGKIQLFGKPPQAMGKKIGWVPQHFRFDRTFPITVLEVVLAGRLAITKAFGGYTKEDERAARKAIEKMGMEKQIHTTFSELSGGQAQRVLLARAIVNDPLILLLDEATANVDQAAQNEIYKILSGLKGTITTLMVTHDLRAAAKYVERVMCVEKKVVSMSPQTVCEHFALGLYHPPTGEKL